MSIESDLRDQRHRSIEHLKAAFPDYKGPGQMYRSVYKWTTCGAGMGMYVTSVNVNKWVYCDELYKLGTWDEMRFAGKGVASLSCSSIVEGIDATTDEHVIELEDHPTAVGLHDAFFEALDEVESEAQTLWDDTHGCPECARHWLEANGTREITDWKGYDDERWEVADTPIWTDCKNCGGLGEPI